MFNTAFNSYIYNLLELFTKYNIVKNNKIYIRNISNIIQNYRIVIFSSTCLKKNNIIFKLKNIIFIF